MTIRERELAARLSGNDDEDVYAALEACFCPDWSESPFLPRWSPRDDLPVEPDHERAGTAGPSLRDRMMDLANDAQRLWRRLRFDRRRTLDPHWPVVVCEGDSWVAHPIIDDITDHLLDDDDLPLHALGVGAASDELARMHDAHDHERMIEQHDASALVLSGGGNDLMLGFPAFLHPWRPGADPRRLLTDAVDARMSALMSTMRRLLVGTRTRWPTLPIVVHGYDHLRVARRGEGGHLAPFFDAAGIDGWDERRAVLWAIVDRYNEHLAATCACIEGISYVDLRGLVPDDAQWADDIHPTAEGFGRLSKRIGTVLLERIAARRLP